MYASTETIKQFLDRVTGMVDLATPPSRDEMRRYLYDLLQGFYRAYVFEERMAYPPIEDGEILLSDMLVDEVESTPRADDVFAVCAGRHPLRRLTRYEAEAAGPATGYYYRVDENKLAFVLPEGYDEDGVVLYYYAVPARLTTQKETSKPVALPDDFLGMAVSKMLGEAYRAANEVTLAQMWLSDYNARLAAIDAYLSSKRPERAGGDAR